MTRIMVTGTSGFIGSHLATLLVAHGHSVEGVDRREPTHAVDGWTHRTCDLLDAPRLARTVADFAPEIVLHLAARTDLDEQRDLAGYAANIAGVRNLSSAVRAAGSVRRTICTSSQLVNVIGYAPASDVEFRPSTLYGASKAETERIWRAEDGGGSEWALVRPTTIWGPRMNRHYLRFFRMIRSGRYRHLRGGPRLKSYGYVGNTVWQYLKLATAPAETIHRRVFFLADYEPIALEAWADAFQSGLDAPPIRSVPLGLARAGAMIGDAVNFLGFKRFPFNSFRLNNVLTSYTADLASTRAICGPLPFTMQRGVDETCRWIRAEFGEEAGGARAS